MSGWANHIEPTRGTRRIQYASTTPESQLFQRFEDQPPLRSDQPMRGVWKRTGPLSIPKQRANPHAEGCGNMP